MHSQTMTCSACGTVNHIIVEGDISLVEQIRCSKCLEPLGNFDDMSAAMKPDTPGRPPAAT